MFSCSPSQQPTTNGGGTCSNLNQAWTARGINVGYYAFKVTQPLTQYSGDFSGAPGTVFQAGPASKGVILQVIPPGAYVGLSSTGPYYDPPSDCFPAGKTCGDPSHSACPDSNPPMRPALAGFAWGYAYSGASHMQGWIPFDPASLEFAGYDAGHPARSGPRASTTRFTRPVDRPPRARATTPPAAPPTSAMKGRMIVATPPAARSPAARSPRPRGTRP